MKLRSKILTGLLGLGLAATVPLSFGKSLDKIIEPTTANAWIEVHSGDNLQDKIDSANALGDTVVVYPGTYNGAWIHGKDNLNLVSAEGKETVNLNGSTTHSAVIEVENSNYLKIGSSTSFIESLPNMGGFTIDGQNLDDYGIWAQLGSSNNVEVSDNDLINCTLDGIHLKYNPSSWTISQNRFEGNSGDIYLGFMNGAEISLNDFNSNVSSIWVEVSNDINVSNNQSNSGLIYSFAAAQEVKRNPISLNITFNDACVANGGIYLGLFQGYEDANLNGNNWYCGDKQEWKGHMSDKYRDILDRERIGGKQVIKLVDKVQSGEKSNLSTVVDYQVPQGDLILGEGQTYESTVSADFEDAISTGHPEDWNSPYINDGHDTAGLGFVDFWTNYPTTSVLEATNIRTDKSWGSIKKMFR